MFRNQNLNGRPGDHGTGQLRVVSYPPLLPLLQIWGRKRAEAEGLGKEEERTQRTAKFEKVLRQLIDNAEGPTEA